MLAPNDIGAADLFRPRTTIDPDGTVEGYASLFGEVDAARDMVMPGAFADTLRLRGVRRIPMLFQHDPSEPVGIWLELREDSRGLFARGKLIPEVARARELHALVKAGAVDGLSIGFRTASARVDPKTRIRKVRAIDLWEISIVTFPLLNGARVRTVKGRRMPYAVSVPRPFGGEGRAAGRPIRRPSGFTCAVRASRSQEGGRRTLGRRSQRRPCQRADAPRECARVMELDAMDEFAAVRQGLLRLRSIVAAERFSLALYRHYLKLKAGYREDQLRDERGRWADEGGGRSSRVRLAASERRRLDPLSRAKIAFEVAKRVIEAFRSENGLWDLFKSPIGTVSMVEIDGKTVFGSNSTSPTYSDLDYREAVAMRDVLITKYPEIMQTEDVGQKPNDAVFHAEANVLLRIARESSGNLSGRSVEVHVDKTMCNSCPIVLPKLGLELGNPTVTFIGPRGERMIMRDGTWVQ